MRKHLLLTLLTLTGCQQPPAKKKITAPAKQKKPIEQLASTVLTQAPSPTKKPEIGNTVTIDYTCWLADEQQKPVRLINNSQTPFSFLVGVHRVIEGLDKGIQSMQVGEKRRFIIPPSLAYGDVGFGIIIPPQATLIFDVTLYAIR